MNALGHTVWIDKADIRAGRSWEEQIEKAILDHEIFLALLSPHAVRRPDGVCLDEISLARYSSRRIIPAMVVKCRPPLAIYRLDWIDLQERHDPAFVPRAAELFSTAIESETRVEGVHAGLLSRLRPIDFGVEMSRHRRSFVGRTLLFEAFDRWLLDSKRRVFFLTGTPGVGKSAAMAQIAHKYPEVAAYHFCVRNLYDTIDPLLFVRSLAAQLATQLPAYRSALEDIDIERAYDKDPDVVFRRLVADPLHAISSATPVLVLVNLLDEALFFPGGRSIPAMLGDRVDDLPQYVRLVVSCRMHPDVRAAFAHYDPVDFDLTYCRDDVKLLIDAQLRDPVVAELLGAAGEDPIMFGEMIQHLSEGNFMYVTRVFDLIRAGAIDVRDPHAYEPSMSSLYQKLCEHHFSDIARYDDLRPCLELLCAADGTLNAKQMSQCLGCDAFDVEKRMERVCVLFSRDEDGHYHFCHRTLWQWLTSTRSVFRINVENGKRIIAGKGIEQGPHP